MKGSFLSVWLAVGSALVLAAGGPGNAAPALKGRLVVALENTPPNLDSMSQSPIEVIMPATHIFEPLYTWSQDFKPAPDLAEGHTVSSDGRVWTIRLRRGVKFHNDKEMTADDVLASIERWRRVSPFGRDGWKDVTAERIDAYTIRLTGKEPHGTLLNDMSADSYALVIIPKEIIQGVPANELKQYIGTGPFMFDSLVPDQYIRLKRFPGYVSRNEPRDGLRGGKRATVDQLEFRIVKDPAARIAALRAGEIDILDAVPGVQKSTLASDPNINLVMVKPFRMRSYLFNFTRPWGSNLLFRRAVQAGIDLQEIALAAVGDRDLFRIDPGIAAKETFYHSDVGKELFNQHDAAKAKRLLAEAGYKGEPIVIIATHDIVPIDRMAVVLKKQLDDLGVNTRLDFYDNATLRQVRTQKDKWDILPVGWSGVTDPNVYRESWYSTSGTYGWVNIPQLDPLMDAASRTIDLNFRKQIYAELQKAALAYIPEIKVFDEFSLRAVRKRVRNLSPYIRLVLWNATVDN